MQNRIKCLLMFVLFSSSFSTVKGQVTTKEITDHFFEIYSKDPVKAIDYAFSTNKWFERKQDAIAELKNKFKTLNDVCGDYYGYEEITEKTAGTSLKIISYLVKYDREPVRFVFLFYKAKDTWRVNNLSFDEDIDEDLKEAAKAYRLKENY